VPRSEAQIALNDVVEACEEAVATHEDAAKRVSGPVAEVLRAMAGRRRERCTSLALDVRGAGELPRDVDADAVAVKQLVSRVKGALAADATRVPMGECPERDAELAARAGRALVRDLSAEVSHHLECWGRTPAETAGCCYWRANAGERRGGSSCDSQPTSRRSRYVS